MGLYVWTLLSGSGYYRFFFPPLLDDFELFALLLLRDERLLELFALGVDRDFDDDFALELRLLLDDRLALDDERDFEGRFADDFRFDFTRPLYPFLVGFVPRVGRLVFVPLPPRTLGRLLLGGVMIRIGSLPLPLPGLVPGISGVYGLCRPSGRAGRP